jgi:hypothetical protein
MHISLTINTPEQYFPKEGHIHFPSYNETMCTNKLSNSFLISHKERILVELIMFFY